MDVETDKTDSTRAGAWLGAMRLRTLPLALASTLTGSFLAMEQEHFSMPILLLTVVTTVLLQVNSNLANDYGDFQHGTDNDTRIGPARALQSGTITSAAMRKAIILFSSFAFVGGAALLYLAAIPTLAKVLLLLLGIAAIYASITYTAGAKPYGYRSLGDLSVLVFFGIVGVTGAFYLQTGYLDAAVLLPALSIGCFSAGVLNVNNTRDMEGDAKSGKITLAVRLGPLAARRYHVLLLTAGMLMLAGFAFLRFETPAQWLFLLAYPLMLLNAVKVYRTSEATRLDPMLKQLALSTFLLSLLIGLGISL